MLCRMRLRSAVSWTCILICSLLIAGSVSALPITASSSLGSSSGAGVQYDTSKPVDLEPQNWYSAPRLRYILYWTRPRPRPGPNPYQGVSSPSHSLPPLRGPWDKIWEIWKLINGEALRKLQARQMNKRGVQEVIAQHYRPQNWQQRGKDFFTKLSGQQLKVTKSQHNAVVAKYRPAATTTTGSRYASTLPTSAKTRSFQPSYPSAPARQYVPYTYAVPKSVPKKAPSKLPGFGRKIVGWFRRLTGRPAATPVSYADIAAKYGRQFV